MNPSAAAFIQELSREHSTWLSLIGLLEEEESALVRGDGDRLSAVNEPKLQRLQEISRFINARNAFLAANQFTPDHNGMADWVSHNDQGNAGTLWYQMCNYETRARNLNERIGILINMRLASTRQALNVLLAGAADQGSGYNHEGMALSPSGGRPLTSA